MSTDLERPDRPESAAAGDSPATGFVLREARLRRGLALAEVAADTRINPAYLEAIEAERWELLPAPVYARGFLRSYARYLRFEDEAIERMVPRNLPRPHDLEPAAGLRRSASQPALALPSFGWLRREARMPVADRERRSTSPPPRTTTSPRPRTFARTSGGWSGRGEGAGGAATGPSAPLAVFFARGRAATRDLVNRLVATPSMALGASGAALLAVLVAGYLWVGRTPEQTVATRPTAVASPVVPPQAAGPEPVSSPTVTSTAAPAVAPPRDGEMPDLVGMSRRDAEDELERLGLAFVVIEVTTPAAPPGAVYNQSPQAGKEVRRGDSVTLLVARAP